MVGKGCGGKGQVSMAAGGNQGLIEPCPQFGLFGGTLPKMAALWVGAAVNNIVAWTFEEYISIYIF